MAFNCTIARNDTAIAACCQDGNSTMSFDDKLQYCLTNDEAAFGKCLSSIGVTGQRCSGPGASSVLLATGTATPPSTPTTTGDSSARSRYMPLSSVKLLLLSLPLLAGVQAAQSSPYYIGPVHPSAEQAVAAFSEVNWCEKRCDAPCKTYLRGQVMAEVNIYSDSSCQTKVGETFQNIIDERLQDCRDGYPMCLGDMLCSPLPTDGWPATIYVKAGWGFDHGAQMAFTLGQNCPDGGAGGVVAVLTGTDDCLQIQGVNKDMGVSYFPCGSGGVVGRSLSAAANTSAARRHIPPQAMKRGIAARDDPKCTKFDPDDESSWDYNAYGPSKRLSNNVNCVQSTAACPITLGEQHAETWNIQAQVSATVDIKVAEIMAQLGGGYTEQETSTMTEGYSIPVGQTGYLSGHSKAVDIPGWFRDCGNGQDYYGSMLVPKANGVEKTVVIVN